jgi:hypothetical protein
MWPCEICLYPSRNRVHSGCQARLGQQIGELPQLYRDLEDALLPGAGTGPAVGGTREAPLPVALEPLSLRARGGIEGVLTSWERAVREDLGWPPVPFRGSVAQTVTGSAEMLHQNLLWLCGAFEGLRELSAEIAELHNACTAITNPPPQTYLAGACPAELRDGGTCGFALRAFPGAADIYCLRCGATYGPATWLQLAAS